MERKVNSKKFFPINLRITDEELSYLESCARIRNLSISSLIRILVETICRDQMVEAVIDDTTRRRYAHRYQGVSPFRGLK